MLPSIQLFGRSIAMYGLMILVGTVAGVLVTIPRRKTYNLSKDDVLFSFCYAGIGLAIGAKLLYILTIIPELVTYREKIIANPAILLQVVQGGFVFYGGLIGAAIGIYIYGKQFKLNLINLLDLYAPAIPLIHGFGRIGCFFAGCCYGVHYHGPFHIVFEVSPVAPNGIPLFPIQLLEAGLNFIAFLLLLYYAKEKRKPGHIIGAYVIYYTIARFILEFFRGDIVRGSFLGMSTSQWISIILIPLGIYFFYKLPYSQKSKDQK